MTEGAVVAERAPAVVAVLVTTDPGAWFDETLQALAGQDYENLSVLVLASGGTVDPTAAVARHLPDAFVRRLPHAGGYGDAVNEALRMVEGASFFFLCHDDCAPAPGAVRIMVEESFRSNAGIVSPKMVHWDDTRVLLHVGQSADKTGAIVERVQDGEMDAGQHDAVRDVFVAPGGCMLARGDLLRALGGYDTAITAMGEELDLSWRAHVAGARVVVAPAATVRHLELAASGRRRPPRSDAPSLQALERRHELAAVLTCYSWTHLVRVVPQTLVLALGEVALAAMVGDRRRVRAVAHAWIWNLSRLGELRRRRAALAGVRVLGDGDVRSLQVRGSARLSTYLSRLTHQGVDVAHGLRRAGGADGDSSRAPRAVGAGRRAGQDPAAETALTGSIGLGFSEDADFDDLDDLGRRGRQARAFTSGRLLASRRSRLAIGLVAALVLVVGSRNLLGTAFPLLGQFATFPAWTAAWHQFVSSWQPAGVGSGAPVSPAFGLLGVAGTVLLGRMGLLQEVLVLGCIPLGAWGVARLLRPFGSPRGRITATLAYLALPLAYDALARGRWDGLVAYAATPWVVAQLARATRLEPFDEATSVGDWRRTLAGRVLALGAIEALALSFAPAMALVVVVCGLGISAGSLLAGGCRRGARALGVAAGGTLVAGTLCLPWVVGTLAAGKDALSVFGLPPDPASSPGWGGLLRMAVGPIGGSPLGWLLLVAAAAPLLVARQFRLAWAVRLATIAMPAWLVALVAAKGWTVPFAPSVDVLLAPAALAVAGCVGLGVAAFETDLAGFRFGWRQGLAALSVVALVVGMLPVLAEAANGRWGLSQTGYAAAAGFPPSPRPAHGYRVLWLGDPRALPSGGWAIGPGLAYATSVDGTPTFDDLWPPASPGRAASLASAVRLAMRGETVQLGRTLDTAGVRYVVVVSTLAPRAPGEQPEPAFPVPAGLVGALGRQEDLRTVPASAGGIAVFENTAFAAAHGPVVTTGTPSGDTGLLVALGVAGELFFWVVVAAALLGRRRWLDWWWVPLARRRTERRRRRRRRQAAPVAIGASVADAAEELVEVSVGGAPSGEPSTLGTSSGRGR